VTLDEFKARDCLLVTATEWIGDAILYAGYDSPELVAVHRSP
jgi:hypothetical protein